ncbi:Glycosyl hydrolase family protein [Arabidopsis thaliana]|uniref:Glycosyl hydrolase family protein n=2 Tax=Arabidopsis thaliana TaxID=3702 RepID=F4JAB3_ARATH|nr:Glycosyl hydrolase family protein [Arabidopsis thaliana]AEE78232.1 Glycosyl hydrolase family protein [Arabidopsis thaliana]|eukprot:NP_001190023.1 Glycosyl hydrolase family protein [Arabidopsis thaliana]
MAETEESSWVYKNRDAPVEARVKDLLSRMTLPEKIGQMTQIERSVASPQVITNSFIGSVQSGAGSWPLEDAKSSDWADMIDGFQRSALASRLGIPIIYGTDAVHGNNNVYGATVFPHNIGLGATRDADLVKRIGAATALEIRASGVHWTFAPCVAVLGDPRWGRCYESYSEAAKIVCEMSLLISGLQGEPPEEHPYGYPFLAGRNNVIACAKHFVGDGGTEKGLSEGNTITSYEDLEKIHVAPYLNCIAQGVSTVMASFSSWNGSRLHSDYFLLTEVLKQKLGFKGFLVSDWDGLETISEPEGSNYRNCVKLGINAGIDMVMVPFKYEQFIQDMTDLVESGEIPMARVNDAVERILRVKFVAGLFEHPLADRSLLGTVGCKVREVAREAVRKSLVLLKNGKNADTPFLPLDRNAKRILVVGMHANDLGNQCGGWTKIKSGQSGRITIGTTLLDSIKAAVGDKTEVIFEKTPTKETLASSDGFSYAIVAVGEPPYAEMKGDNSELTIPFNGNNIITAVAEKIPTLVILFSGRPMVLEPTVLEKTEALVAAWFPGTEGQGMSDVIFGDYDFKGKLPVSWFKRVDQLPLNAEANSYDPLFPLGFGLTSNFG